MLTNINRVKTYLDIDLADTSEDYFIEDIIYSTSQIIYNYIGRQILYGTYREDIKGREYIYPKNTPIEEVIILENNNGTEIDNYRIYPDKIRLVTRTSTSITGQPIWEKPIIKEYYIEYKGGYKTTPKDIELIATEVAALKYKEAREDLINVESKSEGATNIKYTPKEDIPTHLKEILDKYKIYNI